MKLLTFKTRGADQARLGGVLPGQEVLDLTGASAGDPQFESMLSLIEAGPDGLSRAADLIHGGARAHAYPIAEVDMLAPIPRPRKNVYCVGLNFRSHVEQNAAALGQPVEIPDVPLFFSKPVTAVIGTGEAIRLDERLTTQLDYEVELAIVIGRRGIGIDPGQASDYIFGYTIANDVSARDLQWRTSQFLYGKGLDTYCPLGPVVLTADQVPSLDDLTLELLVNNEIRQSESAGHMLFSPAEVIGWLSSGITLEPGDIITLGTPGGCGYQTTPTRFLGPGDIVECRVDAIGSLINPVQSV
ncbi:fumarylacetoacetate hydrolase family protein [Leekyejoonella antrihumi]|nr:fumarylacetoacetate hydrolase family protein [Leekyejoonella antrihumi]